MIKTLALLLDSYRELNAKRLFWIVLVVSGLVVIAFASIGIKGDTITFIVWDTPFKSNMLTYLDPALLYKSMFTFFGVGFWLTWLANILALISTAGIFPDFMAGGSIDLYLSKPIARLRLFLTKYIGGLLFVTLQVGIFSFCSFLVLGTRGHSWEPRIFLSIPLVVMVFSYLYCICVLLGVMTRSTIASLLLTLLIWFGLWGVQAAESILLEQSIRSNFQTASLDRQIDQTQRELGTFSSTQATTTRSVDGDGGMGLGNLLSFGFFSNSTSSSKVHESKSDVQTRLDDLKTRRAAITTTVQTAHTISLVALTVLPKTQATTDLLNRALLKDGKQAEQDDAEPPPDFPNHRQFGREGRAERDFLKTEMNKVQEKRSVTWILSTSIGFEVLIVGLAGWIFCRRDY